MIRPSDVIFVIFTVIVGALLSLHLAVFVFALLGAFACGSIYVFAGMIPSRSESFGNRSFVTVFLSIVLSSVVLILPGTLGMHRSNLQNPVLMIAALIPVAALCFEVFRTPGLFTGFLRWFARR